jgi:UDP-glucose 4-epimerase
MNILLTGGTGYIGSHAAVVLLEADHEVVLYDNLCNSQRDIEGILADVSKSDASWRIACPCYFNPVGAHSSGLSCMSLIWAQVKDTAYLKW